MITPTLDYEIGRILAAIGPIALAAATVAPAALGVALAAAVTRRRGGLHPPAFAFPRARQATRVIGTSVDGRIPRPVALSVTASRQHLHVLGPTGTGKSTLLLNLVAQDIAAGRGCAVLDPKGDLVRDLLARIPRARVDDVVYIGPDDEQTSVGINPLEVRGGEDPELVAENTLAIFKRIYREHWGPRTDDILKASLLTLLTREHPTLAQLPLLLASRPFRRGALAHLHDPIGLGSFWHWYESLDPAQQSLVTAPLLNKLRDFLLRTRLRRLLCQPRSTIDLARVMDEGKILLCDLGTGRWGESASALAGSFIVARLWQAALARQAVPEAGRRDFLLYLDEFQTFLGIRGPFADALAQARSLRLSLTLANQHLAQLPREVADAVAANARSRVVFACARADAATLAPELAPFDASALVSLPPFTAVVRSAGQPVPALVRTRPASLPARTDAAPSEVLAASARLHARPVSTVDADIAAALSPGDATRAADRDAALGETARPAVTDER